MEWWIWCNITCTITKKEVKSSSSKWKRWAAIGVISCAAIALTAGLAAGIGEIDLTTAYSFITPGTCIIWSADTGFVGHKMNNLKSEISHFKFCRISQSKDTIGAKALDMTSKVTNYIF